jgi:hypothetical protein
VGQEIGDNTQGHTGQDEESNGHGHQFRFQFHILKHMQLPLAAWFTRHFYKAINDISEEKVGNFKCGFMPVAFHGEIAEAVTRR